MMPYGRAETARPAIRPDRADHEEPVPIIPETVMSKLTDAIGPALGKIRGVNPAAAKQSATRGAASAKDIATLSIEYIKQETKEPLQGLGRYVSVGAAGGVLIGFGSVLLTLALLRGIQAGLAYRHLKTSADGIVADNGPLSGSLSWLPYFLTALACIAGLVVIALALRRAKVKRP